MPAGCAGGLPRRRRGGDHRGLASLAERWQVRLAGDRWVGCVLVEAWHDAVLVRITDVSQLDVLDTVQLVECPSPENLRLVPAGRAAGGAARTG